MPGAPPSQRAGNGTGGEASDPSAVAAGDEDVLDAGWVLPGLTGAGALLAGALLLGLQRRRRAQSRARRPGRSVPAPPAELAPAEMTINAAGTRVVATVAFMDEALRRLAEQSRTQFSDMPPLAAVQLHDDTITLHLSAPADLPDPWESTPDRQHWSCSTATTVEALGTDHGWAEPPYPTLVTIGIDDRADPRTPTGPGDLWLLNCEELGLLQITGNRARAVDFVRHLTAQLAVNPWSRQVTIECIGIAEETEPLDDRIRHHETASDADRAISELLAGAVSMLERTATYGTDVSTGRTGTRDDDTWPARVLVGTSPALAGSRTIDGPDAASWVDAQGDSEDEREGGESVSANAGQQSGQCDTTSGRELLELRQLVATHVGRTGTVILTVGGCAATAAGGPGDDLPTTEIRLTRDGRVLLTQQGLDLAAVALTGDEAHDCALLYAHSQVLDDVETPVDEAADGGDTLVDRTGAPRRDLTLPRNTPDAEIAEPAPSLLDGPDAEYVATAAATVDDLEALAPRVPESALKQIKAEDPHLAEDLRDWLDPDCPRPKLALLGPVTVRTHGRPMAKYKALCTEIVAYLALRPRHGATRDELAEAVGWNDPARVRKYVDLVRHWLGEDPATRQQYLPHASKSPAARARGVNVYQITTTPGIGLLSDWDLFRRLQARGTHSDLSKALGLITGRPFDQHRPGGWTWLYQGDRHDQHATHAITDVACILAAYYLHASDLVRARAVIEVAMLAVPDEHAVQLCQVALLEAEGNKTDAVRVLLEDVCNHAEAGDGPLDLPERTQEIIRNHGWKAT